MSVVLLVASGVRPSQSPVQRAEVAIGSIPEIGDVTRHAVSAQTGYRMRPLLISTESLILVTVLVARTTTKRSYLPTKLLLTMAIM